MCSNFHFVCFSTRQFPFEDRFFIIFIHSQNLGILVIRSSHIKKILYANPFLLGSLLLTHQMYYYIVILTILKKTKLKNNLSINDL